MTGVKYKGEVFIFIIITMRIYFERGPLLHLGISVQLQHIL